MADFKDMHHKKTPMLMDVETMKEVLSHFVSQKSYYAILNDEIGILRGNPKVFRVIMQQKAPFVINDHRFGIIVRGSGKTNINLVDRRLKAGMFVYLAPGSIINPSYFSEDFEIFGMALFSGFAMSFSTDHIPVVFNGGVRDFLLSVEEEDVVIARGILDTLWTTVHREEFSRSVVSSLVAALMNLYNYLYCRDAERSSTVRSREQTVFDRFLQLVNRHCVEQHRVAYYAQRICLTERYLGHIISKTSGVTAKEWIDRALIMRIKVELIHTDKSVACIADEMNFPGPSFFCKYFKRMVGVTPGEYRARNC